MPASWVESIAILLAAACGIAEHVILQNLKTQQTASSVFTQRCAELRLLRGL